MGLGLLVKKWKSARATLMLQLWPVDKLAVCIIRNCVVLLSENSTSRSISLVGEQKETKKIVHTSRDITYVR